jgi:hypothetical protein
MEAKGLAVAYEQDLDDARRREQALSAACTDLLQVGVRVCAYPDTARLACASICVHGLGESEWRASPCQSLSLCMCL